jgi:hypothetical protein
MGMGISDSFWLVRPIPLNDGRVILIGQTCSANDERVILIGQPIPLTMHLSVIWIDFMANVVVSLYILYIRCLNGVPTGIYCEQRKRAKPNFANCSSS